MYNFWQFIHVASAMTWVGGGVMTLFLTLRWRAATADPMAAPATGLMAQTAVPLFATASLATLATGLIMAFGWIGFTPLWIKIGLAGSLISLLTGFGYHKPHGAKLSAAVQDKGPDDASVQALARQGVAVSIIEMTILFGVVLAMVTKP